MMDNNPGNLVAIKDVLITLIVGTLGGPIVGILTRKPVSGVVIVSVVWAVLGLVAYPQLGVQVPHFDSPVGYGILGALIGAAAGTVMTLIFSGLQSIIDYLDEEPDQEKEE